MNSLAHLAALLVLGWLIEHFFATIEEPLLAFALIPVFIIFLISLILMAVKDDAEMLE